MVGRGGAAAAVRRDRRGLESLEWAVIAAVIALSAMAVYPVVLGGMANFFNAENAALGTLTVSLGS